MLDWLFDQEMPVATSHHYNLLDYNFSDFTLDDDDTLKATIRMFMDLDLIEAFHINYDVSLLLLQSTLIMMWVYCCFGPHSLGCEFTVTSAHINFDVSLMLLQSTIIMMWVYCFFSPH